MSYGAAGALNVILKTLLDPGDEVILVKPVFVDYRNYVDNHGGISRIVNCREDFMLDLEALESLDDDQVSAVLMDLPGVGRWTADMLLMFSLGRLDVLPIGDLALRKSIASLYQLPDHSSAEDILVVTESWRPYRSIASWYCWAAVD